MHHAVAAAGISVMGISVASMLPDAQTAEAMTKWPLVLILAAVAVTSIYLMYRGNRENSKDRLEEAKMHKESIEILAQAITESCDGIKREAAEQKALLAQRPCIRNPQNN